MGPYCMYCQHRCFVLRVLADGRSMLLATCLRGMRHSREVVGQDHTTALNPTLQADEVDELRRELAQGGLR